MGTNSHELSITVKNKDQLYDILATTYYLPQLNSKAITNDYLRNYIYDPVTVFAMKKEVTRHCFRCRKYTAAELLSFLESALKEKKDHPTGLSPINLPDRDWLLNALLYVDPDDRLGLLGAKKIEKPSYPIKINPE